MRAIAAIPFLAFSLVTGARADDAKNREAIGRTLATLNHPSQMNAAFTKNGDGWMRFDQLRKTTPAGACRIVGPSKDAPRPTVTPSDVPWGEAGVQIPPEWRALFDAITFVTKDVALAEGACEFEDNGATQRKPLLLVVKRQEADWKIATVRALAGP